MSDSMRPHRRQPTRLPRPWDSPGKNTGVGCHFLLQCVRVKLLSRVRFLVTPWTTAYRAPPSVGFSRPRVLEWGAIAFSIYKAYVVVIQVVQKRQLRVLSGAIWPGSGRSQSGLRYFDHFASCFPPSPTARCGKASIMTNNRSDVNCD